MKRLDVFVLRLSHLGIRIAFCIYLSINFSAAFAQSYGLAFASHEAVQEERTALDLSPGKTLCFKKSFELSFELGFVPNRKSYFGYIFRIIDSKGNNIDLICNSGNVFTLIRGGHSAEFAFSMSRDSLLKKWNKVNLVFDYHEQMLTYTFGSKKYSTKIDIDKNSCFKFLFGANDYEEFQTRDVPPMKIRNIQIHEGEDLSYEWSLDEERGHVVVEGVSGKNGIVQNPSWIKKMHSEWKLLRKINVLGAASVAFDTRNELLHIVGLDSLITYSVQNDTLRKMEYNSGRYNLLPGNQSYFDSTQKKLYNIVYREGIINSFDFKSKMWRNDSEPMDSSAVSWHFNKFYSEVDSSFYFFGGYGKLHYKNEIRRYHFPSGAWSTITPSFDVFIPRYLAALGEVRGGVYILGGYGSKDGKQINNPKSLYDLFYFSTKDRNLKKIGQLNEIDGSMVFANSMVIDEKDRSFYGLVFPKHNFNSTLQLIRGSLDSSSFIEVGNKIPFKFHDIKSFSDLFYCRNTEKFISVTLFLDNQGQTEVAIYSLEFPPLVFQKASFATASAKRSLVKYGIAVFAGMMCVVVYLYLRNRSKRSAVSALANPQRDDIPAPPVLEKEQKNGIDVNLGTLNTLNTELGAIEPSDDKKMPAISNKIFLFGIPQLFDSNGDDITKLLTPLIKELFLVILLYTVRWEMGISSEKLKELLWFDKTAESARNNRSVNIAKLKSILERMRYCQVSRETGYWKIDIDYMHLNIDYYNYLKIVKEKDLSDKNNIKKLADIVQRGSFLPDLDYEWLDSFKSEVSNEVIDIYLKFASSIEISEDPEFLIKIAGHIFYFDPVNEEAMALKCKALVCLGKHSLAKATFEQFCKEYRGIYGEEFPQDFQYILEH